MDLEMCECLEYDSNHSRFIITNIYSFQYSLIIHSF